MHLRPGSEDAAVLALANAGDELLATRKMDVDAAEIEARSQSN